MIHFPKKYFLEKILLFSSSKENINIPIKKKNPIEIDDDDDDDFISTRKRPKFIDIPREKPPDLPKEKRPDPLKPNPIDLVKECLESIIIQIENEDATCPICNQILSNLNTIDQREQHVNRCLEESQLKTVNQINLVFLIFIFYSD